MPIATPVHHNQCLKIQMHFLNEAEDFQEGAQAKLEKHLMKNLSNIEHDYSMRKARIYLIIYPGGIS